MPPQGIAEALGQPERVDQTLLDRLLTKCGDKLSLLRPPGSIDRDFHIDAQALSSTFSMWCAISVPYVIVDVPNIWAPWTKSTLVQADEVVITATPELASLRNAKNLIDLLKAARPNDRPPRLVLNQVGVPKRPEIPVADFAKALGIEPAIVIPFDAADLRHRREQRPDDCRGRRRSRRRPRADASASPRSCRAQDTPPKAPASARSSP